MRSQSQRSLNLKKASKTAISNIGKKPKVEIILIQPFCNAGGKINGYISLKNFNLEQLKISQIIVQLSGNETAEIEQKNTSKTQRIFYKTKLVLHDRNNPNRFVVDEDNPKRDHEGFWMVNNITPSSLLIPFEMVLAPTLPNTTITSAGKIIYELECNFEYKSGLIKSSFSAAKECCIFETLSKEEIQGYTNVQQCMKSSSVGPKSKSDQRSLTYSVSLLKGLVYGGGLCYVRIDIDNYSSKKINGVKSAIVENVRVTSDLYVNNADINLNKMERTVSEIEFKTERYKIDPYQQRCVILAIDVPAFCYSTLNSSIVSRTYTLNVTLLTTKINPNIHCVEIPLRIAHPSSFIDPIHHVKLDTKSGLSSGNASGIFKRIENHSEIIISNVVEKDNNVGSPLIQQLLSKNNVCSRDAKEFETSCEKNLSKPSESRNGINTFETNNSVNTGNKTHAKRNSTTYKMLKKAFRSPFNSFSPTVVNLNNPPKVNHRQYQSVKELSTFKNKTETPALQVENITSRKAAEVTRSNTSSTKRRSQKQKKRFRVRFMSWSKGSRHPSQRRKNKGAIVVTNKDTTTKPVPSITSPTTDKQTTETKAKSCRSESITSGSNSIVLTNNPTIEIADTNNSNVALPYLITQTTSSKVTHNKHQPNNTTPQSTASNISAVTPKQTQNSVNKEPEYCDSQDANRLKEIGKQFSESHLVQKESGDQQNDTNFNRSVSLSPTTIEESSVVDKAIIISQQKSIIIEEALKQESETDLPLLRYNNKEVKIDNEELMRQVVQLQKQMNDLMSAINIKPKKLANALENKY